MEIVILLVPLAIVLVSVAVGIFLWALRRGQFDDLDSPAWRILFDDQQTRRSDDTASSESRDPD